MSMRGLPLLKDCQLSTTNCQKSTFESHLGSNLNEEYGFISLMSNWRKMGQWSNRLFAPTHDQDLDINWQWWWWQWCDYMKMMTTITIFMMLIMMAMMIVLVMMMIMMTTIMMKKIVVMVWLYDDDDDDEKIGTMSWNPVLWEWKETIHFVSNWEPLARRGWLETYLRLPIVD